MVILSKKNKTQDNRKEQKIEKLKNKKYNCLQNQKVFTNVITALQ